MQEILAKVRLDNGELQADVQDAKKIVDTGITEIEKNSIDLKVDAKSTESLRTQMRKAQQEVAELSARFGATSKAAVEAAKRAAELRDRIGDAKTLTDAFNPDAKFRALSGSIQGVVGGFTALQGAIGAFGVKNEEVEKALLKVNSAMALSQGLQSVGESVDSFKQLGAVIKSSTVFQTLYNFVMGEKVAVQKADVATTVVATAATRAQAAATTTATVATTAFAFASKILRAAIAATGIGAVVVALGEVINNFDSISAWIKSSPLGEFANQVGNIVQKFTDFIGITSESERSLDRLTKANARANESLNARIKILKAQGGSEQEVYKLSKQVIENNLNDVRNAAKVKGTLSAEEAKKIRELKVEELVLTAEYNKKISDDNKKASEKAAEEAKKRNEEAKKRNEEALKQQRELQKKENEIAFNAAQERQKILDEIENANYKNEFDRERQQIRDEFFLKIESNKELEAELIKLREARIAEIDKKEKEANSKLLEEKYSEELKRAETSSTAKALILKTELANGQISEEQYNQKIKDLEESTLQSKILIAGKWSSTVKKAEEDITTFTNQQADNRLNKTIENNKRNAELLKQQLGELATMASQGVLVRLGINPQDADRLTKSLTGIYEKIKTDQPISPGEIADAAGSAYSAVSNAIAASDAQRRQEELAALQVQQEEELRLAGDNEQKKEIIKQKYALKEREVKRKGAEADKRKAIIDATVNTAIAVVKAFATTGPIAGPVFAAIVGALGAAQIALIAAQPIPKFAKGGAVPSSDINGMISGRPHAAGGVLIEAEGNEFITRRSQAMKGDNLGLLEAINMSDSERDAYINRHYVMPALQAKESQAAQNYRSSIIEAENNLIARVSSSTLKSIDRRLVETNQSIKGLAKKDYTW